MATPMDACHYDYFGNLRIQEALVPLLLWVSDRALADNWNAPRDDWNGRFTNEWNNLDNFVGRYVVHWHIC